jgi:hypothetical protein
MERQPELLPRVAVYATQLCALPRRVRRALQRQWRLPLASIALMLALGQQPVQAATIPVGGACTLVAAIQAANADTARGGCPAGSGADTIVLPPGSTQTLTQVHNSTYGPTGLPVVRSAITIAGHGSTIARAQEAPVFRLFAISKRGALTLKATTVTGGYSPDVGGGVANFGGTLAVHNSMLSGNRAHTYCGEYCWRGVGGGVYNATGGTVTITNSVLAGNSAFAYNFSGGGIANYGTLTLTNSTLADNRSGYGGGIANRGTLTILNSTFMGNITCCHDFTRGGGVLNTGTVTILNSTFTGNRAYSGAGGIENDGTLTITNSTLSGNRTDDGAGGIANGGTLTLTNSTLSGNTAYYGQGGASRTAAP